MARNEDVYTISDTDVLDSSMLDLARSREADRREAMGRRGGARASARGGAADPLAASSLSMLVLGAGQAYNGQRQLGALLFLTEALAATGHWSMVRLWPSLLDLAALFDITEWGLVQAIALTDLALVGLVLVAVFQAYHYAETQHGRFDGFGNPLLAGVASFLIPGWGQIMNAQIGKALFFLGAQLTGVYAGVLVVYSPFVGLMRQQYGDTPMVQQFSTGVIALLCACAILWMISVYDAVLVSGFRRRGY